MRLKEHFHWLVPQIVVTSCSLTDVTLQMTEKLVPTLGEELRKVDLNATVFATCLATLLAVARYATKNAHNDVSKDSPNPLKHDRRDVRSHPSHGNSAVII